MRYLRFDSVGGAAGDMILASLAGLGADLKTIEKVLNDAIPEDPFQIETEPFSDAGLNGLKLQVKILKESNTERGLHAIYEIIERAAMPDRAKELARKTFERLAESEAKVHGCHTHHIHFHEVGAVDSIVDILGSCFALVQLGIDEITFGTLPEGTGTFRCRHGIYPIPAPATLNLLEGIQVQQTEEPFEMITPTGAALLTTWPGGQYKNVPGKVVKNAVSFGSRKLNGRPNALRVIMLEDSGVSLWKEDVCMELTTNLDDVPAETTGALANQLFDAGALDVWMVPCVMKKQRLGQELHVLCNSERCDAFCEMIFRSVGTLGIRVAERSRRILERRFDEVEVVPGKKIRVKCGLMNGAVVSAKPEYEDCLQFAKEQKITYTEAVRLTLDAWKKC